MLDCYGIQEELGNGYTYVMLGALVVLLANVIFVLNVMWTKGDRVASLVCWSCSLMLVLFIRICEVSNWNPLFIVTDQNK